MFAAVVGHCSGRAMPSLRNAPPRQSGEIDRGETIYRNRNAVQTNPATSLVAETKRIIGPKSMLLLVSAPKPITYYPRIGMEKVETGFIIRRDH